MIATLIGPVYQCRILEASETGCIFTSKERNVAYSILGAFHSVFSKTSQFFAGWVHVAFSSDMSGSTSG